MMNASNGTTDRWARDRAGRFGPGNAGGPGRPPGPTLTTLLRQRLAEGDSDLAGELADVAIRRALDGDFRFWKEIIDRIDGPIKQHVQASFADHFKAIDREAAEAV